VHLFLFTNNTEKCKKLKMFINSLFLNKPLAASLQTLKRFREAGLGVKTAMQNDVIGIGWCLNDFYNSLGVKYLNIGTHGHRAL